MPTNNVTISGTNVTVTVDGTVVFPTSGSGPKPPEPTRPAIGSNSGIQWGTNAHPWCPARHRCAAHHHS
jgi:hypothetical protein